ncbi:methyltransferase domain-containing protein [Paractinoplanes brasiliensis]|uniref:Methyltransferase family protein n=1 Tax=Paractinoplanes brasiliensis TaxID=52695 RepID=A0A4R6JZ90_9ACTN|nr:methyltransferase domain-containing protein [Actinoplanes brasiliensis]TDO42223.1 methyltransferase family protein [Actinoplanes brasiliensis]GID31910.1 methyltransferase [Actinoplanes brasiliensis]
MGYLNTETLIKALDTAESTSDAVSLRRHTYEALWHTPGRAVVDVGCGTGRAVSELGAGAVGIDTDPTMLDAARARFPGIDVREADAAALPFADASVLGYRADKVYHVLPDPDAALAEARRVLAPGGRIVLVGQDWDAVVIESGLPAVTRRIVHARADTIEHPRIARSYRNLLLDHGFDDVTLTVHTAVFTEPGVRKLLTGHAEAALEAGAITAAEADAWLADQARRAETGRLLLVIPMFLAAATRPRPSAASR